MHRYYFELMNDDGMVVDGIVHVTSLAALKQYVTLRALSTLGGVLEDGDTMECTLNAWRLGAPEDSEFMDTVPGGARYETFTAAVTSEPLTLRGE